MVDTHRPRKPHFRSSLGRERGFPGASRPYAAVRTSRSDGASSPASVEQIDGRKIPAQVSARHRNEEVKEVELSEYGGSVVPCSLFATNPYGRYIWSKARGGAGSVVRRVNPDRLDWSDADEADTWTIPLGSCCGRGS